MFRERARGFLAVFRCLLKSNRQTTAIISATRAIGTIMEKLLGADGGFVYCWTDGRIIKTESGNNTQWTKQFNYTDDMGAPWGILPLSIRSVIETSDGALAILAVGEYHSGIARTGRIYLIKTEAFLPPPPHTPLPKPMPTEFPEPTVESTVAVVMLMIVFMLTAIGLLVFLKKRKH